MEAVVRVEVIMVMIVELIMAEDVLVVGTVVMLAVER